MNDFTSSVHNLQFAMGMKKMRMYLMKLAFKSIVAQLETMEVEKKLKLTNPRERQPTLF